MFEVGADPGAVGMLVTAGVAHESRSSPRYRWPCFGRGPDPFVIVQVTKSGAGWFRVPGRTFEVGPGNGFVALVPEDAEYGYPEGGTEPWEFSWINLHGTLAVQLWGAVRRAFGPVIHLGVGTSAGTAFVRMCGRAERGELLDGRVRAVETYATLVECWHHLARPDRGGVQQVIHYCTERFHEPISVKELAVQVGLSREHLTRLFVQATGRSPAAYVRERRLAFAEELLRTTTLPVAEVARRAGFPSASRFAKVYRARHGTTAQAARGGG